MLALLTAPALSAAAQAAAEVEHLIAQVRATDCRFHRNGEWHDAPAAADHLARKYRIARFLGREGTAEDFIEKAATRSSVTGEPYRVQCGEAPPRPSAEWLRERLEAFRDRPEAAD